ncbi:MAG TPA: RHS repeat-associated core domain-containing protein [Verrucomicrobiae bacterium]|nr:RHS repeat-associated core domain-containing protein [Verrucomicrobiae bacterium]
MLKAGRILLFACLFLWTGMSATTVTYGNLHRIKTYTGLTGSYGYDPTGNITNNIEGGGSRYSYANPRIQAVRTAFGYTNLYDLCGNMIVRHGGLATSQSMTYDPENRLSAIAQAGVMSDEFGYAYDDARLWKRINQNPTNIQVWIGDIYEEKDGKTLFHVFAGSEQVCTFEAGSFLDGGSDSTKVGYYYHQDSLNTSSALSDYAHNQIEVDVYFPFGRTNTASPQANFQVSRRFTGQVFDAESGLCYYNARYYDPELGRFIQPDTTIPDLSNPQSYNRYSYCENDPLTLNDPTGKDALDWYAYSQMPVDTQIAASRANAPLAVGVMAAAITGGTATPLLISAGASTTFAAVGSGMIAGAAGDLAAQGTQIGLGQRGSISGQEIAASSLMGGALSGGASKLGSMLNESGAAPELLPQQATPAEPTPPRNPITAAPGQTQTVDPNGLVAGQRATLSQGRLAAQAQLQQQNIPRNGGPPLVYENGVIYDGHHAVRAAADSGAKITVKVMQGQGTSITGKPVTGLPVH